MAVHENKPRKDLATRLIRTQKLLGKKATMHTVIGGAMLYVGYLFDQGMTDEIVRGSGALLIGLNIRDTVNYLKYKFSKKNPEDYQE